MFLGKKAVIKKYKKTIASEKYILHACGGIDGKYSYVNSTNYMRRCCQRGYKFFEVDVNLTRDNKLVLAHRFAKSDYEKRFGFEHYNFDLANANGWLRPTYDDFLNFKTYNLFHTYTINDLILIMREFKDIYVMLDIGDASYIETKIIFEELVKTAAREHRILDRVIAGGRKKEQVKAQNDVYKFPLINMYYSSESIGEELEWSSLDDFIDYCHRIGATSISTSLTSYMPFAASKLKDAGLFSYVFTCDDMNTEQRLRKFGCDIIGTNFLRNPEKEAVLTLDYRDLWQKKIFAVSLGDLCGYSKTNSKEALEYSYMRGFRLFQVDIRFTKDEKLVCVDRWHKETFKNLDIAVLDKTKAFQASMSYEKFIKAKYFKFIPTMDFECFLSEFLCKEKYIGSKCIISIGRPSNNDIDNYVNALAPILKSDYEANNVFMLRLEQERDVERFQASNIKTEIIYHYKQKNCEDNLADCVVEKIIAYCKKKDIHYVSLEPKLFDTKVGNSLKSAKIKICINKCLSVDQVVDMLECGADLVGSYDYYMTY